MRGNYQLRRTCLCCHIWMHMKAFGNVGTSATVAADFFFDLVG